MNKIQKIIESLSQDNLTDERLKSIKRKRDLLYLKMSELNKVNNGWNQNQNNFKGNGNRKNILNYSTNENKIIKENIQDVIEENE